MSIKKERIRGHAFVADQAGINKLKDDFFEEARDFVYFRKGEWHGVRASIRYARAWHKAHPRWRSTSIAGYAIPEALPPLILQLLIAKGISITVKFIGRVLRPWFHRRSPQTATRRVICGPDVGRSEIREWEDICGEGSVVVIPKGQIGQFRYVVNEKRYALFSRLGSNDLQGIIGSDARTIRLLRNRFDAEFMVAKVRAEVRRRAKKK